MNMLKEEILTMINIAVHQSCFLMYVNDQRIVTRNRETVKKNDEIESEEREKKECSCMCDTCK